MAGNRKIVALGLGVGAGILFAMSRKASAATPPVIVPSTAANKWGPPLALGKNFDLSEFLRSGTFPQVAKYKLTDDELANVKLLVEKILQPIRDKYGPVLITSGGRPAGMITTAAETTTDIYGKPITIPAGATFAQAMKQKGYDAADHSDHIAFAAVNFEIWDANKDPDSTALERAYADLQNATAFPDVRQVILYRTADGKANNVHVAVVYPDHPRITGPAFAFEANATSR